MIHVCFGLYDKTGHYSKFTGTTICSLFDNMTSEVTAHILHDNTLTQDNREKFFALADRYKQRVNFYNVDELWRKDLKNFPLTAVSKIDAALNHMIEKNLSLRGELH